MASLIVDKFFSIFWSDEACRKIFLLHKEELLEKEEIDVSEGNKTFYYSPRFVISNSLIRKDLATKLSQRVQNRELEFSHNLGSTTKRNFDQSKIEEYFNKTFAIPIQEVSKKINNNNIQQIRFFMEATSALLSERKFLKFLQKYKIVPVEIKTLEELGKYFEKVFKTELGKLLTPQRVTDFLASMDQISSYYQNAYIKDLMDANNFYTDILYKEENYKSRISLFDLLYEAGVLQGGKFKAYYECTKCEPEVFNATVNIKTAPSKTKLKCPACGQETFYIVAYEIQDEIFEFIKHKDGLLFHTIKNLLEKKGTAYQANTNLLSDVEADLVLKNGELITDVIEIKMFKSNRPEDTIQKNLESGLKRFLDNRQKLIKSNPAWGGIRYHYITNVVEESLYSQLIETFKEQLNGVNLSVYSPEQFKKIHFSDIYRTIKN